MTELERELWLRVQRRAQALTPQLGSALLKGYETLRAQMDEGEIARILRDGDVDRIFDRILSKSIVEGAMAPARDIMRDGLARGVKYFARDIPATPRIATGFDILNTRVIDAVRKLESKVITNMNATLRETFRAYAENGLREGTPVREVARGMRELVGLAPNQAAAVANFRKMLETGDREALNRLTRDARFDRTLEKALGPKGTGLTKEQIDVMSDAQRRRMIGFHAETLARTAALDTTKSANRLAWEDAAASNTIDGSRVRRTWAGAMDQRERPTHRAMEGQTVRLDEAYSNGEMVPGEADYSCRCIERFSLART